MEAVRDEAQAVGPHPVEELDEGEAQVEEEEAEQVARVGVGEDEAHPALDLVDAAAEEAAALDGVAVAEGKHGVLLAYWVSEMRAAGGFAVTGADFLGGLGVKAS